MNVGITLDYLFREITCGCCGKTFIMPSGMDKENYVYKITQRKGKTQNYKVKYYCSWSCYKKAKAEIISCKKRGKEYDNNWLKWAGVTNEMY